MTAREEEVDSMALKPESTTGLSLKGPAFNITQRETELVTKRRQEEEERKNRIRSDLVITNSILGMICSMRKNS